MNEENYEKPKKNILSMFSSKQSFFLGLGGAAMLAITVGFFILLGIVMNGGASTNSVAGVATGTNLVPTAPAPTPPPQCR